VAAGCLLAAAATPPAIGAQQSAAAPGDEPHVVELTRVAERTCDDPGGWTNLFFEGDPGVAAGAVALFTRIPGGGRVEAVQRETPTGETAYAIRSTVDGREHPVEIRTTEAGRCGTAEVSVGRSGAIARVQVSLADGYIYGRIAEHRAGVFTTGETSVRIEVHPATRAALGFDRLADLRVFVDADGDGSIRPLNQMNAAGDIRFSEETAGAFVLDGRGYIADSMSADGARLHLTSAADTPFPARGFQAPVLAGSDLDGREHDVAALAGRTVIVEFWSTECPFSEQARPEAARLAAELEARGGVYLSMARESDAGAIRAHLDAHPRKGIVLTRDDAAWERWNRMSATPLYYVIGPDGTILLREVGARAVRLAAGAAGIRPSLLSDAPR
jgi:thiol-disulfide isomerase/thioredoxin